MTNEMTIKTGLISALFNVVLLVIVGFLVANNSRIRQQDQRQFDDRYDTMSSVVNRILWSTKLFSAVRVDHAGIVIQANPRAVERYGLEVGSNIEMVMESDALEKHRAGFAEKTPRHVSIGRRCTAVDVDKNVNTITLDVWTEVDGSTAIWVDE